MGKKTNHNDEIAKLRKKAEKQVGKRTAAIRKKTADNLEEVINELNLPQIELELQSEEMRQVQFELEKSRSKYADLYDFAPVGYFTIDKKGAIIEANLTGCRMLGLERSFLIKKPFSCFVNSRVDHDKFFLTRRAVISEGMCGRCDLKMVRKGGGGFYADILIEPVIDKDDKVISCRVALIDISKRKEAEQKLLSYQEELRRLSSELSLSQEKTRRKIALRVHDEVAQNLAIAKMKLDSVCDEISSSCDVQALEQIGKLLDQAIENIRSLTNELSVPILYEVGFISSLQWLTENMQERFGLSVKFNDDGLAKPLSQNMQVLLFQAIRELLVNVVKHANAKHVKVTTERLDNHIYIKISDDGAGFDSSKSCFHAAGSGGFGLFSIRENMIYARGSFEIESAPGKGTTAILEAPLEMEKKPRVRQDKQDINHE
jgi:PAS domain S-box-containing protein